MNIVNLLHNQILVSPKKFISLFAEAFENLSPSSKILTILIDRLCIMSITKLESLLSESSLKKKNILGMKIIQFLWLVMKEYNNMSKWERILVIIFIRRKISKIPNFYEIIEKPEFKEIDNQISLNTPSEVVLPVKTFLRQILHKTNDIFEYKNTFVLELIPLKHICADDFLSISLYESKLTSNVRQLYSSVSFSSNAILKIKKYLKNKLPLQRYSCYEYIMNTYLLIYFQDLKNQEKLQAFFARTVEPNLGNLPSFPFLRNLFLNFPEIPALQISSDLPQETLILRLLIIQSLCIIEAMKCQINLSNTSSTIKKEKYFLRIINYVFGSYNQKSFFPFDFNEDFESKLGNYITMRASGVTKFYKCSCGYVYGIGNCGMAWVVSQCPVCRKQIGGTGHKLIQRKGHNEISTTYISKGLSVHVSNLCTNYYYHGFLDLNKLKKKTFNFKYQYAGDGILATHMFSHLFYLGLIYSMQIYDKKMSYLFKKFTYPEHLISDSSLKFIYPEFTNFKKGKMSENEKINALYLLNNNSEKIIRYFSLHILNDIKQLKKKLHISGSCFHYLTSLMFSCFESVQTNKFSPVHMSFYEFISSQNARNFFSYEMNIASAMSSTLRLFKNKKVSINLYRKQLLSNQNQNKNFEIDWMHQNVTYNTVILKGSDPWLSYHLRHTQLMDSTLFENELVASTASKEFCFTKFYVKHKVLLDGFIAKVLKVHLDLSNHFNKVYAFDFTFEELRFIKVRHLLGNNPLEDPALSEYPQVKKTLAKVLKAKGKDSKLASLYSEFCETWKELLNLQERFPKIFNFNFECHQNLDLGVTEERLEKRDIALIFLVVILDTREVNLMLTIFQTCCKFQNHIIETFMPNSSSPSLPLLRVTESNLVKFNESLLQNRISHYVHSDPGFGNGANFEFEFHEIEADLVQKLKGLPLLRYSSEHVDHFQLRDASQQTSLLLSKLEGLIREAPLFPNAIETINEANMDEVENFKETLDVVLFRLSRSTQRDPSMSLVEFCKDIGIENSKLMQELSLTLGNLFDCHKKLVLRLSTREFYNNVLNCFKVKMTSEQEEEVTQFKNQMDPKCLEVLKEQLKLYIIQKCNSSGENLVDLSLFEFMSYSDMGELQIECEGNEVSVQLETEQIEEEFEIVSGFVFSFLITHKFVFEILKILNK
jgi:hypothetical protein